MPVFKTENKDLETALIKLQNLVAEYGGYISDHVIVAEENGELHIYSDLPKENHDKLIELPEACLPRIMDFEFKSEGNRLLAEPKSPEVCESHVALMAAMIKIYNLTDKLTKHRETNMWLALENFPDLVKNLYEARYAAPKIQEYYEKYSAKKFDELMIDTFIGARTFELDLGGGNYMYPCLMPFMSYANHSLASPGYTLRYENDRATIALLNFQPRPDSNECFVRYRMIDALDGFLLHGFVDTNVRLVRSIPLQFDINEYSRIQVQANISRIRNDDLPAQIKDINILIPIVLAGDDSVMELSHLIIPGPGAPYALRRILAFYISGWKPGLYKAIVNRIVNDAERFIISENLKYYENLLSAMDDGEYASISEIMEKSVKSLIQQQINSIRQHQERIANL